MNLIPTAPLWLIVALCCAMVAAGIEDAARYRISNIITLIVLAGAIAAAVIEGPSLALWQNVTVFVLILILGAAAFSAGWLGGGDVKLFAAAGLWFDFPWSLRFIALVFLAGGVVAIAYLVTRPLRRRKLGKTGGAQIPYGIAIAVGMIAITLLGRATPTHHESALPALHLQYSG